MIGIDSVQRLYATALFAVLLGAAGAVPGPGSALAAPGGPEALEHADRLNRAFMHIAETVTPTVVSISSTRSREEGRQRGRGRRVSMGSGVIVSADGYLLTNNHVIERAENIQVMVSDGRTFEARVVGTDITTDLAVLQLQNLDPGSRLPAIRFGDSDSCRIGAFVLAIGNPMELGISVTAGIISAKSRRIDILSDNPLNMQDNIDQSIESFIQTDAVINPGNSGGALVNLRGELIGINTAIASRTGVYQGYGFAIPVNLARRVMEDLIELGRVVRPVLGVLIKTVDPLQARALEMPNPQGVLVEDFSPRAGSPAELAGIERGDVIVAVDSREVAASHQLQEAVAKRRPGDVVKVRVFRQGRSLEFDVRLGSKDVPAGVTPAGSEPRAIPRSNSLGLRLRDITPRDKSELGLEVERGVVVDHVADGGVAVLAGLNAGDVILRVNRTPVAGLSEIQHLLDDISPGTAVMFMVVRDGTTRFVGLEMP